MTSSKDHYQIQIGFVGRSSQTLDLVRHVCNTFKKKLQSFETFHQIEDFGTYRSVTVLIIDQNSFRDQSELREWGQKFNQLRPTVLVVLGGQETEDWLSGPIPSCVKQFIILGGSYSRLETALSNILKTHSEIPPLEVKVE